METNEYLAAVRRDADAMLAAARSGLETRVPSCPDWDVRELVSHLGRVHRWVTQILRDRAQERIPFGDPPADGEDIVAWFEAGAEALLDALSTTAPDVEVWNWAGAPPRASFWSRRMAHENAVHRWDGENAHGAASPLGPPALAADGIDEMADIVLRRVASARNQTIAGSLHLHCTDTEGEWLVHVTDGKVDLAKEHGKGDVALRGPASDLWLLIAGRGPIEAIEVFGDDALAREWIGAFSF